MAINTTAVVPTTYTNTISDPDIDVFDTSRQAFGSQEGRDNRSSSLSEIGDRADQEQPYDFARQESEANDTEAETERLDDSPLKQHKHQNIVLTSSHALHTDDQDILGDYDADVPNNGHRDPGKLRRSSDVSSLGGFKEEDKKALSGLPTSPKKRKRSSFEDDSSISSPEIIVDSYMITTEQARRQPCAGPSSLEENTSQGMSAEEDGHLNPIDANTSPHDEITQTVSFRPDPARQKHRKGKRKGKRIYEDDMKSLLDKGTNEVDAIENIASDEATSSNGGEVDLEDCPDIPEQENTAKSTETARRRRTALNSLNSLEQFFATFRDKFFDERIAQCNEELAMLDGHAPRHPDFLAMKEAVDQRRDQKIKHEDTLMKYNLQTLSRASIATKSELHSQYFQTVRDIRDEHLRKLNEEWHQYQMERRNVEGDVPEFAYRFPTERSQQMTQQTAYNMEVSVLSGVAKYHGFPAAPPIIKARPNEVEDDLRNMGTAAPTPNNSRIHPPAMKAGLSATASVPQQHVPSEKPSFENQAWVNPLSHPDHPSHPRQRQHMQRQLSALSRTTTPFSTPTIQKRIVELTEAQGSAPTIAEHQFNRSTSTLENPITAETIKLGQLDRRRKILDVNRETFSELNSSRSRADLMERTASDLPQLNETVRKDKSVDLSKIERDISPAIVRLSKEAPKSNALPKPLPFLHTSGLSSANGIRASTPGRYPVIKSEETNQLIRHSSVPHQYHASPAVSTVPSGQLKRFTA